MVALYNVWYNFMRIHKKLRVSPATSAAITQRLWLTQDIVEAIDARPPELSPGRSYKK